MSALTEVQLTAAREFRRNLRSAKGIAMIVLFVIGGTILPLLRVLLMRAAKNLTGATELNVEQRKELWKAWLEKLHEADVAKHLMDCPPVLYFLFWTTTAFVPFFILMMGFDQIAGDVQHRTLRYMTGRAHRGALVAGKALGVWGVISVMILLLHIVVWGLALAQGTDPLKDIMTWGPRIWLFSSVYAAAYVGLISLVSSFFRTPVVGLFLGMGVLITMVVLNLIVSVFKESTSYKWIYQARWVFPSSYYDLLLSPDVVFLLAGLAALLGWGALCVTAASEVVRRRDI
ncbi:MAG: ABC transporter permease [Polyangiaceae bacterium]